MTSPPQDLHRPWSLREVLAELAAGRTTPAAVHQRSRTRIAETDPHLRAWVATDAAPVVTTTSPLRGVPLGVKDIIDVAGLPTRCGSVLRADAPPARADAAVVAAWRRAGAVPVGKTVTTEFAYFSPGPTRNPAAPDRTPGGSSSGSAAAVAAGHVPLALGSQTAGSVTRPASFCGVASLVMGRGRLPLDGVTGLSPSLDSHGVYAASVSDLALAWSCLTDGADAALTAARPPRVLLWRAERLGVVEDPMHTALDTTRSLLVAAGATVDAFTDEELVAEATGAHSVVMAYEAARERSAELARSDRLSEPFAALLSRGVDTSDADHHDASLVIATAARRVRRLLTDYDVIVGPAAPGPAPAGLDATGDPVLSRAWQAMGLPVVTVPALTDPSGLPLGIQVIGLVEGQLLTASCAVETALRTRRSPAWSLPQP